MLLCYAVPLLPPCTLLCRSFATSLCSLCRCQLFLAHLAEQATELGLTVSWSLPLDRPLPLQTSSSLLYVQMQPLAYLVVGVAEGLVDHAHLLQLAPTFTLPQSSVDTGDASPQSFYTATSLMELNTATLQTQRLRAILGQCI